MPKQLTKISLNKPWSLENTPYSVFEIKYKMPLKQFENGINVVQSGEGTIVRQCTASRV